MAYDWEGVTFSRPCRIRPTKASIRAAVVKLRQKRRLQKKVKRASGQLGHVSPSAPSSNIMYIQQFQARVQNRPIGVTPPGYMRFLIITNFPRCAAHIPCIDRKPCEWLKLFESWKHPPWTNFNSMQIPQHIRTWLEGLFKKEMRVRWALLRMLFIIRRNSISRVIGTDDLYTLCEIPESSRIYVRDITSRSVYIFHTQTILKSIMSAITYCQYGMPYPQNPKNPYTNQQWSFGQLLVIVQQIITNLANSHRMPPKMLIDYRISGYDCNAFYVMNASLLAIHAAQHYFEDTSDPDTWDLMTDMIKSLYADHLTHTIKHKMVKKLILKKYISPELHTRWTNVIVSFWLWENYKMTHPYASYNAMVAGLETLHLNTLTWWLTRARRILPRIQPRLMPMVAVDNEVIQHD